MDKVLSNPEQYNLGTPIVHLDQREQNSVTYGDACLEAGGRFSNGKFWWHVEWPESIKKLTLKRLTFTRKCNITHKLVSINLLEFAVQIINYAAITVMFKEHPELCPHGFPLLLNWIDNMSAKSWIRKACTKSGKGKALQRILCILMMNNPVRIKAEHIAGLENTLADAISRIYSTKYSNVCFKN